MLKNLFAMAAVAAMLFAGSSCITQVQEAPASNTYSNEKYGFSGNYSATLGVKLFDANQAVQAAAKAMRLIQLSRVNALDVIDYEYKDVYETRLTISVKRINDSSSRLTMRMGKTGDKKFYKAFMAAVDAELRARAADSFEVE